MHSCKLPREVRHLDGYRCSECGEHYIFLVPKDNKIFGLWVLASKVANIKEK